MIRLLVAFTAALFSQLALGQANGKLQIRFMDVGQGEGAVLISPQGQIVLFDGGNVKDCPKPVSYLAQLEIKAIDYMVLSHYHADHFGCEAEILAQSPLKNFAYDHLSSCRYVKTIDPENLQRSDTATPSRTLHSGCPRP